MKWMLSTTLAVAVGLSAAPRAQSGDGMGKPMNDNKMTPVTYTGCVESAPAGGVLLTHVDSGQHMSMKAKDMPMKSQDMSMNDMKDDHMMSERLRLIGSSSLDKHLGQKVSVKGSVSQETAGMQGELPAFNVTSLKVVAKSCS